jgi:hypothetical protein
MAGPVTRLAAIIIRKEKRDGGRTEKGFGRKSKEIARCL